MSLTLSPSLMLLVFIVFMLLIILLNSWLYRPILEFMAKREAMLLGETSKHQQEKEKIERLYRESQAVVESAREEARLIREMATKEAQAKYEESFERARGEIEARFNESQKALEEQRLLLREELISKIPVFKQEMQEKIEQMGR